MPTWPATLPPPFQGSLTETPAKNKIATQMDKGPKKLRRRTTANVKPIDYSMKLTSTQIDILFAFHDDDLYSGVLSFDYTHPRTDEVIEARFVEEPTTAHIEGDTYSASIKLEIMP